MSGRGRVSSEALLREAALVRALDDRMRRGILGGQPSGAAFVDPQRFLAALSQSEGADAVLLAEAATLAGTERSRRGLLAFAVTPTQEQLAVAPIALAARLRQEHDGMRRAGLWAGVERAETRERKLALAGVDALRGAEEALRAARPAGARPASEPAGEERMRVEGARAEAVRDGRERPPPSPDDAGDGAARTAPRGLLGAVGWVTRDPRAIAALVLRVTGDAYRELWLWRSRTILERTAETLRGSEHAALARVERADGTLPLPDREGIASRWCERCDVPLPSIAGTLPTPLLDAPPLRMMVGDPDARPSFVGAPDADTHGVLSVLTAVGELLTTRGSGQGSVATALGPTRLHGAIGAALARRLLLSGPFLMREASVDRSQVEAVSRELLYLELERVRTLAVQTLALEEALAREPGLGERIAEAFRNHLGTTRAPELAPHRVAEAWDAEAPRHLEAALFECVLEAELRDAYDEDWFRNPRAGARLRGAIDGVRALGPAFLFEQAPADVDGSLERALDARLRRWFQTARA